MTGRTPRLTLDTISVGYRSGRTTRVVLSEVSATVAAGEVVCLIGPNGAGKSTLLRSIARFQPLLAGVITVDGDAIGSLSARELARRMAVVLTERIAPGHFRAWDVAALGRYPYTGFGGRLGPADRGAVRSALEAAGAEHLADRAFQELSDGERQRVMIARALAQQPSVLLLDEPTAFLDVRGRLELTRLLLILAREQHLAVVLSTHDLELLLRDADTVWLIDPDRAFATGAPEDLGRAGQIQHAIGGDGVFDPVTGTFRLATVPRGTVRIDGDGPDREWTGRALARAGYAESGSADLVVTWSDTASGTVWQLRRDDMAPVTVRSLGELVDELRRPKRNPSRQSR